MSEIIETQWINIALCNSDGSYGYEEVLCGSKSPGAVNIVTLPPGITSGAIIKSREIVLYNSDGTSRRVQLLTLQQPVT